MSDMGKKALHAPPTDKDRLHQAIVEQKVDEVRALIVKGISVEPRSLYACQDLDLFTQILPKCTDEIDFTKIENTACLYHYTYYSTKEFVANEFISNQLHSMVGGIKRLPIRLVETFGKNEAAAKPSKQEHIITREGKTFFFNYLKEENGGSTHARFELSPTGKDKLWQEWITILMHQEVNTLLLPETSEATEEIYNLILRIFWRENWFTFDCPRDLKKLAFLSALSHAYLNIDNEDVQNEIKNNLNDAEKEKLLYLSIHKHNVILLKFLLSNNVGVTNVECILNVALKAKAYEILNYLLTLPEFQNLPIASRQEK